MTVTPASAVSDPVILPGPAAQQRPRAHLVGICGAGMRGLAELLVGLGWQVSGSDLNAAPAGLQRRGMVVHRGHAAGNLPSRADVLIYSPAIPASNPERQAALAAGVPQQTYTECLGRLLHQRQGVCIAGTHGKSTTTAMMACLLRDAGWQASAIFGAELCENGRSSWAGTGDTLVIESCEFQRSFLRLTPTYAAILGVEPDHFDCFADREELIDAFGQFAARVSPNGLLLVRHEDEAAREAARQAASPVQTFGWNANSDWWATDLRRTPFGTRFRLFRRGHYVLEASLSVPGRHNVLNAVAAAALGFEMGVTPGDIRRSLQDFAGIRRRFEIIGSWRGATIVDDYAHHPTAVATTLQTARDVFGERRLWCLFQPHQVSRTQSLMDDFSQSFRLADRVVIAPVFAARETVTDEPWTVSAELARRIMAGGTPAETSASLDHLIQLVDDALEPGDVLLTMGAGDIDQVHHALTRRLYRDSETRRAAWPVHLAEGGWTRPVLPHSA